MGQMQVIIGITGDRSYTKIVIRKKMSTMDWDDIFDDERYDNCREDEDFLEHESDLHNQCETLMQRSDDLRARIEDDVDDPNDFSIDELLHYERSGITAGAY